MAKLLMTGDNPHGWKLEELLGVIAGELTVKCQKVRDDPKPQARHLLRNNQQIIGLLAQAEALQRDSMDVLATLGADPGPGGTPRIGVGSTDQPDMLSKG